MKLSSRLLSCAELVQRGNIAADVGTDHGYLALYLLEQGICPRVYASDLREQPLMAARRNAARAGVTERIEFCLSDGVQALPLERIQTVICAGMGGDNMISILSAAPALRSENYQLILQPQSAGNDLRRWLGEQGFSICREKLSRDGKFLYTAMEVRFGKGKEQSPGEQFISPALRDSGDPLLKDYMDRVRSSVEMSVQGLHRAKSADPQLVRYYETALAELRDMEAKR